MDACSVGAPAEQLQHLEAALALWPAVPDAAERAGRDQSALLLETATAARTVGELHRAVALLRAALEVLGPDADPVARARVHYTLAQAIVRVEDPAGAHRESAAAMALVPADPPSEVRTWAAATHARMSYSLDLMAEGDAAADEALAAADALGLDSAWSDTAVSQVRARPDTDRATVRRRLDEALERARRSGDVDVEMRVLFNQASVAFEDGRIDETLTWTRRATRRARDLGIEWSFYPAELRHLEVTALYMEGNWDASLAEADLLARVPEMAAHVRAAGLLVQVGRGDPEARSRLDWARGLIPRLHEHVLLVLVTAGSEIDLAAWDGDAAKAVEVALTASRRLQLKWEDDHLGVLRLAGTALAPVADAAAAARLVGDTATVARWVGAGEELAGLAWSAVDVYAKAYGAMGVEAAAGRANVETKAERRPVTGTLPRSCGGPRSRRSGSGTCTRRRAPGGGWRRRCWPPVTATVLSGGGPGGARGGGPAGRGTAAGGGRGAGARAGGSTSRCPVRRGSSEVAAVLTPRETEVLAAARSGPAPTGRSARTLFISEKTASVHVSNIIAKLGASGRTEAVAIAGAGRAPDRRDGGSALPGSNSGGSDPQNVATNSCAHS